jgi:small conductance mechanosensitive channel
MAQLKHLWQAALDYLPNLFAALLVFCIGWVVIRMVVGWGKRRLIRYGVEPTLTHFLASTLRFILKLLLLLAAMGMVGVETTSFLAVLGAAGLAVGLALKDSLSHFAGGVLIILFKPFQVGDLIGAPGQPDGFVERITMLYTYLRTFDSREIIIPNGNLANGAVINYSVQEKRRVDMAFNVSYKDNLTRVRAVMLVAAESHPLVLQDPAPIVTVDFWDQSSIKVSLRPWCLSADYFTVLWDLQEQVKLGFDAAGLEIPFPHQVSINQFPDKLRPVLTDN